MCVSERRVATAGGRWTRKKWRWPVILKIYKGLCKQTGRRKNQRERTLDHRSSPAPLLFARARALRCACVIICGQAGGYDIQKPKASEPLEGAAGPCTPCSACTTHMTVWPCRVSIQSIECGVDLSRSNMWSNILCPAGSDRWNGWMDPSNATPTIISPIDLSFIHPYTHGTHTAGGPAGGGGSSSTTSALGRDRSTNHFINRSINHSATQPHAALPSRHQFNQQRRRRRHQPLPPRQTIDNTLRNPPIPARPALRAPDIGGLLLHPPPALVPTRGPRPGGALGAVPGAAV